MNRIATATLAACLALAGSRAACAQAEQQALVDRATLAVQEIMGAKDGLDAQALIRNARGVIVCPRIFRAGFLIGGSGGYCVLSARDARGGWSFPAFYDVGSGSIGLQAGVQDAEVLMLILTDKGLGAVLDSQFKFGGDASASIGTLGNFIQGATTANVGADIVVTGKTRGLFAGLTLEGSLLSTYTDYDAAYYGHPLAARQIVSDPSIANPGAEPLRQVLAHYSGPLPAPPTAYAPPPYGQPPYGQPPYGQPPYGQPSGPPPGAAPGGAYDPGARAPVSSQNLPPPRG